MGQPVLDPCYPSIPLLVLGWPKKITMLTQLTQKNTSPRGLDKACCSSPPLRGFDPGTLQATAHHRSGELPSLVAAHCSGAPPTRPRSRLARQGPRRRRHCVPATRCRRRRSSRPHGCQQFDDSVVSTRTLSNHLAALRRHEQRGHEHRGDGCARQVMDHHLPGSSPTSPSSPSPCPYPHCRSSTSTAHPANHSETACKITHQTNTPIDFSQFDMIAACDRNGLPSDP